MGARSPYLFVASHAPKYAQTSVMKMASALTEKPGQNRFMLQIRFSTASTVNINASIDDGSAQHTLPTRTSTLNSKNSTGIVDHAHQKAIVEHSVRMQNVTASVLIFHRTIF